MNGEPKPELAEALAAGDLERIRALLDAGADVRYVRDNGYAAVIDAMYGRDILKDPNLPAILGLLIDRGADLDATSDYGESALAVASRVGRFDAVRLLLNSGADPAPLGWTDLHRAVALGTVADVQKRLEAGDDPTARDGWDRTPLLLCLQIGDIAKAQALLDAGASLADRGRCGQTALMYPIDNDDSATLQWLLDQGADPSAANDFGDTPLTASAETGAVNCARALLAAGADPNLPKRPKSPTALIDDPELAAMLADVDLAESPMKLAATLEIARLLAAAGGDLAEINDEVRDELTGRTRAESINCSPGDYQAARHRTFGTTNPQLMNHPFQRAMVASGKSAYQARQRFDDVEPDGEPVWCFARFGKSFTELADGRVIEIGGEHEDYYDEDFCIYNDVIVHHGGGRFDIYGYPRDVFPPTDFHSATLIGDHIYIIGSLGYPDDRRPGFTPVFRLNVNTLAIERVETLGQPPGWISNHKARRVGNVIEITGGKVCGLADGEPTYEDNHGKFLLDLDARAWSKV